MKIQTCPAESNTRTTQNEIGTKTLTDFKRTRLKISISKKFRCLVFRPQFHPA